MRPSTLRDLWSAGKPVINGWLGIPSAFSAEVMAHMGWDSLCIDLQHGLIDYQVAAAMMQAISTTAVQPMVRVPWNDPAIIMKCLDAGAYGVVCPMINTRADAERFVGACRYSPMGYRSLGPIRASIYGGSDYADSANVTIVTLAMIETREALSNLTDILAVSGLDGVYIGPADLGLSMGKRGVLDPTEPDVLEAIGEIARACEKAGKRKGIHTGSIPFARRMIDQERFDFVTILSDNRILSLFGSQLVAELKSQAPGAAKGSGIY